jgi:hypothetical protein
MSAPLSTESQWFSPILPPREEPSPEGISLLGLLGLLGWLLGRRLHDEVAYRSFVRRHRRGERFRLRWRTRTTVDS